jgi:uncharacterized protein (DUF2147 family)
MPTETEPAQEIIMKRLFAIAGILLAATAAEAGDSYTFDIGGRTIHIEAPSNCRSTDCVSVSVPGVYESGPRRGKRFKAKADREREQEAREYLQEREDNQGKVATPAVPAPTVAATPAIPAPATAKVDTPATPAPATPAPAPVPAAMPAPTPAAEPIREAAATQPAPVAPTPVAAKPAAPATVIATAPVAAPVQRQQTPAAAARPATSPLGVWLTEEKEGKVRIEPCGANLCGYSVNATTDANGDKVLINMKPVNDGKWSGRIFDPNSGSTYDSTIALKSPDSLRVQGCAFGGMFCGGQTWSRMN